MEPRREGNRIDEVGVVRVGIGSGNCRMLPNIQTRDCLNETCVAEIGVCVVRTIPTPETGIYGELGKIGEPPLIGRPDRYTTRYCAEMGANQEIEFRRAGSPRF